MVGEEKSELPGGGPVTTNHQDRPSTRHLPTTTLTPVRPQAARAREGSRLLLRRTPAVTTRRTQDGTLAFRSDRAP